VAWLTVVVSLVACASHLGRVAHMLVVRHAYCEHHELVEAGDAARAERVAGERKLAIETAASHRSDHDHCDALGVFGALLHGAPATNVALLPLPLAAELPGAGRVECGAELWRLAPKTSPPASA
jgi:hypothetical protein